MKLTREQIDAELTRRGVNVDELDAMQKRPRLTRDQIDAELRRRGVAIPGEEKSWYENAFFGPVVAGATGFNKGVEDVTHGLIQPLAESRFSNNAERSRGVAKAREERFREASRAHPISANIGNFLGSTAISLPATLATSGASALTKLPGFLKYLSPMISGGIGGATSGAAHYVNPGDSRLQNAAIGAATGLGLGALGIGAQGVRGLASSFLKTHPSEKFASKFIENMNKTKNQYSKDYKNLFTKAKESGVDSIELPKLKIKDILEHSSKSERKYLKKLIEDPTLENAHKAQSDLGTLIRRLNERKGLTGSEKDTLESALKAQNKIRSSIGKSLSDKGQKGLAKQYNSLTEGYARDVIPYRMSNAISKFDRKKPLLTPEDFRNKLAKESTFKALVGAERHPELYKLPSLGKIGTAVGGATLGYKLGDILKGS